MTTRCERCGVELHLGDYPFCPHGTPAPNSRAQEVTWPGGKVFENGFHEPRRFYSPAEYHAALAQNGFKVRGDGEEHGTWLSRESLTAATALVTRCTS